MEYWSFLRVYHMDSNRSLNITFTSDIWKMIWHFTQECMTCITAVDVRKAQIRKWSFALNALVCNTVQVNVRWMIGKKRTEHHVAEFYGWGMPSFCLSNLNLPIKIFPLFSFPVHWKFLKILMKLPKIPMKLKSWLITLWQWMNPKILRHSWMTLFRQNTHLGTW